MSTYLQKSTLNLNTAEMLVKSNDCASSVNRAYYSCLQFILHILIEKQGHSYADIQKLPGSGTHSKAQYLLESFLISKVGNDKTDYKWFHKTFPLLKQSRVIADYMEDPLVQADGYNAINTAKTIITTLKKHF